MLVADLNRWPEWQLVRKVEYVADLAGFELQIFDRYPNAIGVIRDGCIALVRSTPTGLELIGAPGWRMGASRWSANRFC